MHPTESDMEIGGGGQGQVSRIEADGRPRYRIKSKTENVERVVTEEQISRLG